MDRQAEIPAPLPRIPADRHHLMSCFKRFLDLIGSDLPAILLTIVLLVVSADVFLRTAMRVSFHEAHDIAILAFSGVVWFGVVGASLNNQLFGVRFFVDKLPRHARRYVQAATHLTIILISVAVLRAAIAQVETARFTMFLALGWPKWIVSAALAIAMVAIVVTQIIQLLELRRGWNGR